MLSHSISLARNQSELQFISDIVSLCNRHKLNYGQSADLDHLAPDLIGNDPFRTDLFTLCTAISHFDEIPPSPEQLLHLVVRAFGGPGLTLVDTTTDIPQDARSVFLTGYQAWSEREPDTALPQPIETQPIDSTETQDSPQHTAAYYAASGLSSDRSDTHEDHLASDSTTGEPSRLSITLDPPLESLTSNELRMYFEDIERRMRQIELEQFAILANSSDEDSDQLDNLDGQSVHQAKAPVGAQNAARVHRLHTVIAVLTFLLVTACTSATIFGYRFFKPQHSSLTASSTLPLQPAPLPSATSPASLQTQNSLSIPNMHPDQQTLSSTPIKSPTPTKSPAPTKSESPLNNSATSTMPPSQDSPQQRLAPSDDLPDHLDPPTNIPVAVPAATMMAYSVSTPDPIYPPTRHFGVDSTVAVKTSISKDGEVTDAQALTGTPAVRAAALQAVQTWRFKPFLHNGTPIAVVTTFKFFFGSQ